MEVAVPNEVEGSDIGCLGEERANAQPLNTHLKAAFGLMNRIPSPQADFVLSLRCPIHRASLSL